MVAQMELRLVQEDPPSGPAASELEGWPEHAAEGASRKGMSRRRPGVRHQLAEQDLGHKGFGNSQQIFIRRSASCRLGDRAPHEITSS
jgi:hypothetical protein